MVSRVLRSDMHILLRLTQGRKTELPGMLMLLVLQPSLYLY